MRGSDRSQTESGLGADASRRAMHLMAGLFLVKAALLGLFVTPLWDVPDEVGHYALIADIADGRGLPLPGRSVIPPDVIGDWAKKKTLTREETLNWVAQHPPLYHLVAVPFLEAGRLLTDDPHLRYRAPRLLSAFSGAGALLVFFEVFLEAAIDPFFAFVGASALGFVPMFSHMSSGTNHDVFLALLCGVAALCWVRLTRSGRFGDGLRMALALTLAGAVKLSAIVVAAALLILAFRSLARRGPRRWLEWTAMVLVSFCLPALWALRQWILLGNARLHPVSNRPFDLKSFFGYLRDYPVVDHTFKNFFGLIGWTGTGGGDVRWFQISGIYLIVFLLLTLAGAIGTGFWLWKLEGRGQRLGQSISVAVFLFCVVWLFAAQDGSPLPKRVLYGLLVSLPFLALPRGLGAGQGDAAEYFPVAGLGVFLLFALAYLVNSWGAYQIYGQMRATNGRYFFAILPFLVLAFFSAPARLLRPSPRRDALLAATLVILFVNETAFFVLRVIPFYRGGGS